MKCCVCGKTMSQADEDMYPVDPKGTPDRRWACESHVKEAGGTIPEDVKKTVADIKECLAEIDGGGGSPCL